MMHSSFFRHISMTGMLALLLVLPACGYQNPPGQWHEINTSSLYFAGVSINDGAITGYKDTCLEARQEIEQALARRLPARVAPLAFSATGEAPDNAAVLSLQITRCDIDVDQYGDNFSFYLSLPVQVTLTLNNRTLLDYPLQTFEQLQTDVPNPVYEFSFEEAIARTLLLFDGPQLWLPAQQ